ncbi:MAG: Crp/Fnr family transcriptional regulator [Chloroflexi bacterium]|nr:Crp/Fnr family transcriptional regulator [Chloroflexota bacterium]
MASGQTLQRAIPMFARVSDATLAGLARVAIRTTHGSGETVIIEGDTATAVYFVADGQVSVYRMSPSGREQVLAILGPGQAFNTVPPFQKQPHNHASVRALVRTSLLAVLIDDFRRLVAESPDLALAVLDDFAERLDHLTNLVEDLSLRTVRGRLARFLLERADQGEMTQRWTQDEMAAQLGTVRDVVGRTLRSFVDGGLIRIERNKIVLLDREGLYAEAETA